MRTWRLLVAALLAVALVAGGCGDDGDDVAEPPVTTEAPEEEGGVPVHTIGVDEQEDRYTFEVPAGIQAGAVTFELDNTGERAHDFQLVTVDGQHGDQEIIELIASEQAPVPDWIHGEGGVGTARPGSSSKATVELKEGEYVYFCTERDEGEEAEGEGATTTAPAGGGATTTVLEPDTSLAHIAKGMLGRFTVSGDSGAAMPTADATITADEYAFTAPASLDSGTTTVELTNTGDQLHHLVMFPIAEGKTIEDVKAFVASEGEEPSGPPPVDFEKGVALQALDPDRSEVAEVDLDPGTYVMLCFLPDRGTAGPPHVAKGMLGEINVE